jgi:hypothetical protein
MRKIKSKNQLDSIIDEYLSHEINESIRNEIRESFHRAYEKGFINDEADVVKAYNRAIDFIYSRRAM